ncbi:hypothetical protein Pedsa_3662 [Pseudopedobacter saltans DSM 12145]|uniref:Uncharacterized protein n=1 Tax=Pseudopedobacter saltans (strain ATCC 51119 / DSM 12145 / JCM 21818 / CCUG 39354 / LMG 10337 / NBRC 100064 / NCIMB 13643) TaxID=762903 RepID=F0S5L7_PSESL|nr:hypothetical protein [Pseudopedobacter saltans]ADY54191.1 hypothetical protein Pedsa_3662 [Pseudopedobacter saltans DSM 12145]
MKNIIITTLAICIGLFISCDKSDNLVENCYKARLISNNSTCGTVVQIVAGNPVLPQSFWMEGNGIKYEQAYSTNIMSEEYKNGSTFFLKVSNVSKPDPQIMPAVCGPLPQYAIVFDLVDENCSLLKSSKSD